MDWLCSSLYWARICFQCSQWIYESAHHIRSAWVGEQYRHQRTVSLYAQPDLSWIRVYADRFSIYIQNLLGVDLEPFVYCVDEYACDSTRRGLS